MDSVPMILTRQEIYVNGIDAFFTMVSAMLDQAPWWLILLVVLVAIWRIRVLVAWLIRRTMVSIAREMF